LYGDDFYMSGESPVARDMAKGFTRDNAVVLAITIGAVLLILFVTFRNALLPVLLTFVIQGGIWLNFAIPAMTGSPMIFIGYLMVSAIQMGATIDYAIVLTNRYRQLRRVHGGGIDTMATAVDAVFPTILTSGGILTLTGVTMSIVTKEPIVASLGQLLGLGAFISVLMVLFVLPPLLVVTDKATEKAQILMHNA
jgi:predicted RND superfamily exporter protein